MSFTESMFNASVYTSAVNFVRGTTGLIRKNVNHIYITSSKNFIKFLLKAAGI
jgi:hypothetical protein